MIAVRKRPDTQDKNDVYVVANSETEMAQIYGSPQQPIPPALVTTNPHFISSEPQREQDWVPSECFYELDNIDSESVPNTHTPTSGVWSISVTGSSD